MSHYFRFVLGMVFVLALLSSAVAAPQYEVTNLTEAIITAYPCVESIDAFFLNEAGQVGGTCKFDNNLTSAFLYDSDGQFHFLDAPGTSFPDSHGVIGVDGFNDLGQIVGIGSEGVYLWDTNTGNYEVLFSEISDELADPDTSSSVSWMGVTINNQGQIAGTGIFPTISNLVSTFFWDPDDGFQVISEEGYYCYEERLNDVGGCVMSCHEKTDQDPNEFIATWNSEDGFVRVPWLEGAQIMIPIDMDDEGKITFWSWCEDSSSVVLWSEENGFSTRVETATSGTCTNAVNDLGEMVGSIFVNGSNTQAIYWPADSSEYIILDTLVDYHYGIQYSQDINNAGLILAESANLPGMAGRATLLLTPVPEPGTCVLLGMLLGMLTIGFVQRVVKSNIVNI